MLMVLTFISIPALPLYDQVLHKRTSLSAPAAARACTWERCYVTVRVVESCLIAVGIASLLAVVTRRQDLAGAAGTDHASFTLTLPESAWELSLGSYLIVKGFKPSLVLYETGATPA